VRSRSARLLAIASVHLGFCVNVVFAADPKVPAGRDPGGIAVAIVGGGLDYRRETMASRLARDGEGELIGWDFVDGDRHPFAASGGVDRVAGVVLAASKARLIPVRVAADSEPQIVQALRLLDETPTRIVVLAAAVAPIARGNLAVASHQLGRMLMVVPARMVAPIPAAASSSADAAGLLVVSASGNDRQADLIVEPGSTSGANRSPSATEAAHPDDLAAARVAALAARLATVGPTLAGPTLRARILALARPRVDGAKVLSGVETLP
jgi:hypothetical protein